VTTAAAAPLRCGDHLDLSLRAPVARDEAGGRCLAGVFFVVQVGGTLPVPLYVLWQARGLIGASAALDEVLDVRLRRELPEIGEVFIDVTTHRRHS
jgi:hypothetical protein